MGNKTYKLYDYLCEKENYESRDSQKKFIRIVGETIDKGGIKIIQAPTGTGKTYGYLIPIIESQQKAIISTGTKLLQEQLRNDVDNLKSFYYKLTGNNVSYLVMKGKNNYLCLDRFNNYQGKPAKIGEELLWDGDKEFLQKTDSEIWNKICVDEDYCTDYYRSICKYKDECLYWAKLKSRESQANILIVNHALLTLSDFEIEKGKSILVIDEAHELDKYITSALTKTISTFMLKGILDYIKQFLPSANLDVEKDVEKFFNNFNEDFSKLGVGEEEVPLVLKDNNQSIKADFPFIEREKSSFLNEFKEQILDPLEKKYMDNVRKNVVDEITNHIKGKRGWIGPNLKSYLEKLSLIRLEELSGTAISNQDSQDDEELIKKLKIYEFLKNKFIKVEHFYETLKGNQGNYGLSISREYNENLQTYNYIISLFPIFPKSQFVDPNAYKFNLKDYKGVIITSATADPEDLKSTLDIEGDFTNLPHNFSYKNVKFCICNVNPRKEKEKWSECLKQSFKWLVSKYDKVLVLLTNKEDFKLFQNEPETALLRKDEQVSKCVEDLKKGRIKALVGLDRLWFGVDVPGEKGILIAKIPFEYPGDPLNFYRERYLGKEKFWEYYKRKALIKFKQGIGRMMRTRNDGGTIILCDNRIFNHEEFMKFIEELKGRGLVVVKECKCDDKFLEEIMKSDKEK
jgi:ATP-dependent DNA helicase DinG